MSPVSSQRRTPAVLCLHSSAASSRQWEALKQQSDGRFDVIAPDLHGHGNGPAWLGEPADVLAADCARVARIAREIPGGVHLVGHSYGGAVALRTAVAHPELVRSLTVYEPVLFRLLRDFDARSQSACEIAGLGAAIRRELRAGRSMDAAARFIDYWAGRGTFSAMPTERCASIAARIDVIAAHFVALWNDGTRLETYTRLTAPTLLLMGERTRTPMRRIVELVRSALPNVTFGTMPEMGHMGPITHAQAVAQRIAAELVARERVASIAARRLAA